MDEKLHKKLKDRREKGTLRSLSLFEDKIDFFSNDYLGLARLDIGSVFTNHGGTGSRLISGHSKVKSESEALIANFFKSEAALMFNSGYDANLGFFSAVPQRGDTVIYDALIHASVRDGLRLGLAQAVSFKHNDLSDLRKKLERSTGAVYVAVESLYSMDGDVALLNEIAMLTEEFKAYLVVDEAHACGVFGEAGRGIVDQLGLTHKVFARLVTFGKAYGSHGAVVLGSSELIDYLLNFSRSFIYTTALPDSVFDRNARVISHESIAKRQSDLQTLISLFLQKVNVDGLISNSKSPIQIVEIGSVAQTRIIADQLQNVNIAVKPIYSPTVQEGKERLRICIHAFNSQEEIQKLVEVLNTSNSI